MATFDRGWKAAMKLPRSAILDHSAEKRPWNCQGRQCENVPLMDLANGWKAAVKLPRLAVWGLTALKCWKAAMKLPRSAVWERGHETAKVWVHEKKCGSNCQGRQFYSHFFKLPNMAGLPKCSIIEVRYNSETMSFFIRNHSKFT